MPVARACNPLLVFFMAFPYPACARCAGPVWRHRDRPAL